MAPVLFQCGAITLPVEFWGYVKLSRGWRDTLRESERKRNVCVCAHVSVFCVEVKVCVCETA